MMNTTEMKSVARANTVALLTDVLENAAAVQFADNSWAILQTVDGQEIWTEITVKTKAFKATQRTPAFDPFEVAQVWQEEKEAKEAEKVAKAAAKAREAARKTKKEA